MTKEELNQYIGRYAQSKGIPAGLYRPIHKEELVIGRTYHGHCRNTSKAIWCGDHFEYERYKWGSTYIDKINHYEDDNGFDVFVPIKFL